MTTRTRFATVGVCLLVAAVSPGVYFHEAKMGDDIKAAKMARLR